LDIVGEAEVGECELVGADLEAMVEEGRDIISYRSVSVSFL
jgi:hypothetical protein